MFRTNETNLGLLLLGAVPILFSGALTAQAQDKIELTISATQQEYMAQDRAIWDLYEEENPGVKINLMVVNLETEAAYQARVAAGDPADIRVTTYPDKDNYKRFLNLCQQDVENWQYLTYDARNIFDQMVGTNGVCPSFNVRQQPFWSFIYYADEMEKAGLDPKNNVESVADLMEFLAELKTYVDSRDDLDYVLDTGWHAQVLGRWYTEAWAVGLGATKQDLRDVYEGKVKWTDQEKNPFSLVFSTFKEFYDLGYLPEKWWTRAWKTEFEAGLIARKSIFTFHGPWMWDKILAQDPDAVLDGFFLPANAEGKIWADSVTTDRGSVMYGVHADDPNFDEALKAFNWWNTPAIVKLRAEAIGFVPAMDLSSVGGVELTNPQFIKVVQPVLEGNVEGVEFDNSLCGECTSEFKRREGTPRVLADNTMAEIIGDYMEDRLTLAQFLQKLQDRYDLGYEG